MRITAAAKAATRDRILRAAHRLFTGRGFASVTTRDIARAAGIAAGTLFNYFPTKEAVAVGLAAAALADARAGWDAEGGPARPLDEGLFTLAVVELRALEPHRGYFGPVLETALKPLPGSAADPSADEVRLGHLNRVRALLAAGRPAAPAGPVAERLYWSLYTGVLALWAADPPPERDETLAILDQSVRAFVLWLDAPSVPESEVAGAADRPGARRPPRPRGRG